MGFYTTSRHRRCSKVVYSLRTKIKARFPFQKPFLRVKSRRLLQGSARLDGLEGEKKKDPLDQEIQMAISSFSDLSDEVLAGTPPPAIPSTQEQ